MNNLMDRAIEILERDEDIGICEKCGNEQPAEQDAHDYTCEECETPTVQGAMVLIGMA